MTATAVTRNTPSTGLLPAKLTLDVAAAVLLIKGTMASLKNSGTAGGQADIVHSAQPIVGILTQTYDNAAGAAGDLVAQLETGVYELVMSGTPPLIGVVVFAVDNQTVAASSSGGTRGVAGYFVGLGDSGAARVWISPAASGSYADVSAVTSTANKAAADTITLAVAELPMGLGSFVIGATGAQVPAFSNGVADGLSLVDSEALAVRINDDSTTVFVHSVKLPADFDPAQACTLRVLAGRVGSSDTTATFTPHVFRNRPTAAHDAGGDLVTGDMQALSGATKVVTALSKLIDQAALVAGDNLTITLQTTAAADDDDLLIYAAWVECHRAITSD